MYPRKISPFAEINTNATVVPQWKKTPYVMWQAFKSNFFQETEDWIPFIRKMLFEFEKVRQGLSYVNTDATHHNGDDTHTAGWAGVGMIPIAAYLYYLKSYGIKGKVLECGVFKGGSTCCLSHICHYLDLELIAADSFAGLPDSDGYYGKGDFKGGLTEVKNNVEKFGRPEVVTYIQGWFCDSLKGFDQDLMLIWLDVDLKQSVIDVLTHTFSCLVEHGVIFCDGLGKDRDFQHSQLMAGSSESSGVLEFFHDSDIQHKAIHSGYGHLGLIVPGAAEEDQLIYCPEIINRMIFASLPLSQKLQIAQKKLTAKFSPF
jgi:hypothetical protein